MYLNIKVGLIIFVLSSETIFLGVKKRYYNIMGLSPGSFFDLKIRLFLVMNLQGGVFNEF